MNERLERIWKDPVWSKIIANSLWAILIAAAGLFYIFYQKLANSASLADSWNHIQLALSQSILIQKRDILYFALATILLFINRTIVSKILYYVLENALGIKDYNHVQNFALGNHKKKTSGVISAEKSGNIFNIKPTQNTKHWKIVVYFSHSYDLLTDNTYTCKEFLIIQKDYNSSILVISNTDISQELMTEYEDQEITLSFDYDYELGGIVMTIRRMSSILYKSDLKYGCKLFTIISLEEKFDNELTVVYNRYE